MGVYSEYLNRQMGFEDLTAERKTQLRRISSLRDGRDVLVYASDLSNPNKANAPIMIGYGDLLPINDQLANLSGSAVDLILETPGGSGEIAEDKEMGLRVTDYSTSPDLADAIRRYHTLLQMTFSTNIYKVVETVDSQIYRFIAPQVSAPQQNVAEANVAEFELRCPNCKAAFQVQANLEHESPLQPGRQPFPKDNKFRCPNCSAETDLSDARRQIEAQSKKPVV